MRDGRVTITLTGGDAESHWATLADYVQVQYIPTLIGVPSDLSGATWVRDTGRLFLIHNSSGPGANYEYSTTPTLLRRTNQLGFVDTEAIAWMGGTTFAIAEENNNQRISRCEIAPRGRGPYPDRSRKRHVDDSRGQRRQLRD